MRYYDIHNIVAWPEQGWAYDIPPVICQVEQAKIRGRRAGDPTILLCRNNPAVPDGSILAMTLIKKKGRTQLRGLGAAKCWADSQWEMGYHRCC